MEVAASQEEIKAWFDQVYRRKGFAYLRPRRAYDIFATLLEATPGKRHLDVACGLGLMLKTMSNRGVETHGVDISSEGVRQAKTYCPEATVAVANAESLPFEDHSFDYLTCLGSLERMLNREQVLQEQVRVAKPGARFCFMVRNSEHVIWRFILKPLGLQNKTGHQDALNLEEWTHLFRTCGLKPVRVERDHWPYFRLLEWIWPFRKVDTSRPRKLRYPLSWAYEFIFILEKA